MTLPVSTSGRDLLSRVFGERGGGAVPGGVVGDAVEPAGGLTSPCSSCPPYPGSQIPGPNRTAMFRKQSRC
jgi:hypothetical protein